MGRIQGKDRLPKAIRYSAWLPMNMGAVASTTVNPTTAGIATTNGYFVLPFAMKIMAVTTTSSAANTGLAFDIALGTGAYLGQQGTPDTEQYSTPPIVATAGQSLFGSAQGVTPTANSSQVLYPATYGPGWDAIWPAGGLMTVRFAFTGTIAGAVNIVMYGVPVDIHPQNPQNLNTAFTPIGATL